MLQIKSQTKNIYIKIIEEENEIKTQKINKNNINIPKLVLWKRKVI